MVSAAGARIIQASPHLLMACERWELLLLYSPTAHEDVLFLLFALCKKHAPHSLQHPQTHPESREVVVRI